MLRRSTPTLNCMVRCPHCSGEGISLNAKRWASREAPAQCTLCGRLSHVLASTSSGIPVATLLIVGAFFVAAAGVGLPIWSGVVGVPLAVCYNVWAWRRAELFPISGESAATSRQVSWVVNILAFFGIFWS